MNYLTAIQQSKVQVFFHCVSSFRYVRLSSDRLYGGVRLTRWSGFFSS